MNTVTRSGDWRRAAQILAGSPAKLSSAVSKALQQEAHKLRAEIVQGLTQQAPGGEAITPPAASTLAARRLQGFGGTKALIVRADLRNSVAVVVRRGEVFIGVPRSARGADGRSLVQIAEIHEFGSAPTVIPMTDAMRRFLFVLFKASGQRPAQGGAGRGVVVTQTPARPFLRPAFERFKQGAQRRFIARVAELMELGGR